MWRMDETIVARHEDRELYQRKDNYTTGMMKSDIADTNRPPRPARPNATSNDMDRQLQRQRNLPRRAGLTDRARAPAAKRFLRRKQVDRVDHDIVIPRNEHGHARVRAREGR